MVEIRIEPLSYMLLNGLSDVAFAAHDELECEHFDVPYTPDWEAYQRAEDEDSLRFFALRDNGVLIGYASIIIDTDIHRMGLRIATFRDIYIVNGKRGHAAKFVKFVEKSLATIGVRRIYAAERFSFDGNIGEFYKIMGFAPQERVWAKSLN